MSVSNPKTQSEETLITRNIVEYRIHHCFDSSNFNSDTGRPSAANRKWRQYDNVTGRPVEILPPGIACRFLILQYCETVLLSLSPGRLSYSNCSFVDIQKLDTTRLP
ncbi:hypothetical protein PoB_006379300 [Plakobranchus ocellatus]|uniref:Uncharacterized protein n=1 Tax=Plakobranchus ocellatus TaxID=259542 RepID=A0AAV4CZD3_9GAST|nr:hypothetical protein PoB_006379300 [Plakobranchus ocellatus]